MKRSLKFVLLLCLAAGLTYAAEEGKDEGDPNLGMWKWANFIVLAIGLGYLAGKMLPPMFAERSHAILKDMTESQRIRQDAEARAAEVDRRLAGLEAEIAKLRTESKLEAEAETKRLAAHTAAEVIKIQTQAEREIVAAGKNARTELKRYAAGLAIDLAEQKIKARMTPHAQDSLVRGFVRDLQ